MDHSRGTLNFYEIFYLSEVVMMLASTDCRVALVTTHIPLSDMQKHHKRAYRDHNYNRHRGLQQVFQIPHPRIHVLGLNPHAGEDGHLGREEIEVFARPRSVRKAPPRCSSRRPNSR